MKYFDYFAIFISSCPVSKNNFCAQQSPALERDALAFAGFEMYKLSYAGVLKYSRDFTCVKRYTLVFAVV